MPFQLTKSETGNVSVDVAKLTELYDSLISSGKRVAAFLWNNPHNPTGEWEPRREEAHMHLLRVLCAQFVTVALLNMHGVNLATSALIHARTHAHPNANALFHHQQRRRFPGGHHACFDSVEH